MRGEAQKIKTLEITYMRYSLVVDDLLFIGTEEKMIYMVDTISFEIIDRMHTQSYVFSIAALDRSTIVCGQY
jgi:hypothetical protein